MESDIRRKSVPASRSVETLLSVLDSLLPPWAMEIHAEVVEKGEEGNSLEAQSEAGLAGLLRTLASQIPGPGFIFSGMRGPEGSRGMWESYFLLCLANGTSSSFFALFVFL